MSKKPRISPRKAPTQTRSRDLVDTILAATTRILVSGGYEKSTTNRIAELAGVSIGSLYQYFPNKEALLATLIENQIETTLGKIEKKIRALADRPTDEIVDLLVETVFDLYLSNRKLYVVLFEQAPRLQRLKNVLLARRHASRLLRDILERTPGGVALENLDASIFVLVNAVMGVVQTSVYETPEGIPLEAIIGETSRLIKLYLLSPSGAPRA